MWQGFQIRPDQASTIAQGVDYLYYFLTAIDLFFTAVIFSDHHGPISASFVRESSILRSNAPIRSGNISHLRKCRATYAHLVHANRVSGRSAVSV